MAFSRKVIVAAFAGSISLAMAAGCAPAPGTAGTPSTAPSTGTASSAPSSTPTSSTPSTGASGTASATPTPAAVPSPSNLTPTTVTGTVYDEKGATVDGATVEVKSLNASNPFDSTVNVTSGNYVVNNVPAGVSLQITVTKSNYTNRSRVVSLLPLSSGQANTIDFGSSGTVNTNDTSGAAYFISQYPEIDSVTPADQATGVSPTTYSYVLHLSAPLDATNQSRFANAIRVWPANDAAAPSASSGVAKLLNSVYTNTAGAGTGQVPTDYPLSTNAGTTGIYAINEGSVFGNSDTTANVSWDSTGQTATLTFKAPLITSNSTTPRYQVGLALKANATPIEDTNSKILGAKDSSAPGNISTSTSDQLVLYAFKSPSLAVAFSTTTDSRINAAPSLSNEWAQTHENVSYFDLAEDNTAPTLTAVSGGLVGSQSRILLTFSEPMAAYDGTDPLASVLGSGTYEYMSGGKTSANLTSSNYIFAFGKTTSDVNGVDLNSTNKTQVTSFASIKPGSNDKTAVYFSSSAVKIDVDPTNPNVIRLTAQGSTDQISTDIGAVKVRVINIADPAGNTINDTNSTSSNVQTGTI